MTNESPNMNCRQTQMGDCADHLIRKGSISLISPKCWGMRVRSSSNVPSINPIPVGDHPRSPPPTSTSCMEATVPAGHEQRASYPRADDRIYPSILPEITRQ